MITEDEMGGSKGRNGTQAVPRGFSRRIGPGAAEVVAAVTTSGGSKGRNGLSVAFFTLRVSPLPSPLPRLFFLRFFERSAKLQKHKT